MSDPRPEGVPAATDPLDGPMRATFDALNAAAIPYVVLRGFQPLEELAASVDVDLYVPAGHAAAAAAVLERAGWSRRRHQVGRHPHTFFDSWEGSSGLVRSIDLVTDLCYGDALRSLRGAETIAQQGELLHGVRVPSPWDALFTLLLHVALDKGGLSANNARRARELVAACSARPDGRAHLVDRFGEEAALLVDAFAAMRLEADAPMAPLVARARALRVLRPQPARARLDRVRRRWVQFRRPVARVAVLGIDGSGKSTLVAAITTAPSTLRAWSGYLGGNAFRTWPTRSMHAWLSARRAAGDESSLAFRVIANLQTLWWPVELLVRVAIAEHRSELVLYDRYPLGQDDGSPTSRWGRVMAAYGRWGRRLLPPPDLVILLDGDDRVLWERKREFPFEVHQRTQALYRRVVGGLAGETAVIRTDGTRERSFAEFKAAIAGSAAIRGKLYGR